MTARLKKRILDYELRKARYEQNTKRIITVLIIVLSVIFIGLFIVSRLYSPTGFVVLNQSGIERTVVCEECSEDFIPALKEMTITLNSDSLGTLVEYYPSVWALVDSGEGLVSVYDNISYKIEWNLTNLTFVSYVIKSPESGTYQFKAESENGWNVAEYTISESANVSVNESLINESLSNETFANETTVNGSFVNETTENITETNETAITYQNITKEKTLENFFGIMDAVTAPGINFTSPTPSNNSNTFSSSAEINISITNAADLAEFKWNWNGTNYTFYDNNLVLMYNFDNVSAIGENKTMVVDISKYGNNGTLNGYTNWLADDQTVHSGVIISTGWNGYTTRNIIQSSYIGDSGDKFRLKIRGPPSGTEKTSINKAYICERSSGSTCTGGTITQVTFNGGSSGVVSDVNGYNYSDWMSYNINSSKDYLVSFYYSDVSNDNAANQQRTSYLNGYFSNADDAGSATMTSPTTMAGIISLELIEINSSGQKMFSTGKYGKSINFAGGNNYISIPVSASINLTNNATFSFWMKTTGSSTQDIFRRFKNYSENPSGGTASASSILNADNAAAKAFDGDAATYGWGNNNAMPSWLEYDYGAGNERVINKYRFICSSTQSGGWGSENYNPKTWKFEGYNGSDWITLDTISDGLITMDQWKDFSFSNTKSYQKYRINISAAESGTWVHITELQLFSPNEGYAITTESSKIRYYVGNSSFYSTSAVNDGNWHFVSLVVSRTNVTSYIDGSYDNSSISTGLNTTPASPLTIGGNNSFFNGNLDEIRIYNRSSSAAEIKQQYYSSLYKYDADKWQFYSNQSGLVGGNYTYIGYAKDNSGNSNKTETRYLTKLSLTMTITETLNPSIALANATINVYGHMNLSDGTVVANNGYEVYSNGTKKSGGEGYLNLSGGTGGTSGAYTYTAPDGTIVSSDKPVYNNDAYYYMSYLFDRSTGVGDYKDYWLTNGANTNGDALIFNFTSTKNIDYVNVSPKGYAGTYLSFYLQKSMDGITWTNISSSTVDGSGYNVGQFVNISINDNLKFLKFVRTGSGANGYCLGEVEIYESKEKTNSSGDYSYNFTAPSTAGTYAIKVNTTYNGVYGENTKDLAVVSKFLNISFVSPTPSNGTSTTNASAIINISTTDVDISEFKLNWNGTNYPFYDNNLVLMYNFDNVSALGENNTKTIDLSLTRNNGTVNGSTWTNSGKYRGAFEFDGANDYVKASDSNSLDFGTGKFAISVWFKAPSGAKKSYRTLVSKSYNPGYWLQTDGGGKVITATGTTTVLTSSDDLFDNVWHNVVISREGTGANQFKMYVDGYFDVYGTDAGSTTNAGELRIGDFVGISGRAFNGSIDEVRIWNRSLSADEVKQNYYSNLNKYDTDKWLFYANESNLTTGTYTYNASAKDNLGNEYLTETRYLIIDTTPPIITLVSPANNTVNKTSNNITFFYNITDISDIANCSLILNIIINQTNSSVIINASTNNFTATLIDGNYNWSVNCTDILGNTGASAIYNLTVIYGPLNITEILTPDTVSPNSIVNVSGHVSFSNGTDIADYPIDIYLNTTKLSEAEVLDRSTAPVGTLFASANYDMRQAFNLTQNGKIKSIQIYATGGGGSLIKIETNNASKDDASGTVLATSQNYTDDGNILTYLFNESNQVLINGSTKYWFHFTNPASIYRGNTHPPIVGIRVRWGTSYNNTYDLYYNITIKAGDYITTNGSGYYNYSFTAPSSAGIYPVKVNATYSVSYGEFYGENTVNLTVTEGANQPPSITSIVLNATSINNLTSDNLTLYYTTSDSDGDNVNVSINWFKNQRSYPATPKNVSYNQVVLNMPFENYTSNTDAYEDYSTYRYNSIVYNAVWNATGGHDGYGAYEFNNSANSTIFVNDVASSSLDYITTNLSVELWTKTLPSNQFRGFFQKGVVGNLGYWEAHLTEVNVIRFIVNGDINNLVTSTSALSDKVWYHLVFTYSSANNINTSKIYINGVLNASKNVTAPLVTDFTYGTNTNLTIGRYYNTPQYSFNGTIDNFKVYNITLSPERIMDLYNGRVTDVIVSDETAVGDVWYANATPSDGTLTGTTVQSNNITIISGESDTTSPNITLVSPANNTLYRASSTVNFYYNVSDSSTILNCSIIFNNIINSSNSSISKTATNNFSLVLANKDYNWSINCTDSAGNTGVSDVYNLSVSYILPNVTEYTTSNGTTNFSAAPDITNVTNLTLATTNGKIQFPPDYGVDASGDNYDSYVEIGAKFISVNTSALDNTFNNTANLTLNDVICAAKIYYGFGVYTSSQDIINEGRVCNALSDPSCTNINCDGTTLTFTASHFTGYAASGISNLTIWDETDSGMTYGGKIKYANEQIKFFANYTNSSGNYISGANCTINFTEGRYNMTWNATSSLFEYNRSFSTGGVFNWNVTCNKTGYDTLTANDNVAINQIQISFVDPTPASGTSTTNTSFVINISLTNASGLNEFKWNWNGTNYTIYNDSLVLMMNFDNVSVLGENSTYAVDVSKYRNNATVYNGASWTKGKYGKVLSFTSGSSHYASAGDTESLNITGEGLTIAGWFNLSGSNSYLLSKSNLANQPCYNIQTIGTYAFRFVVRAGSVYCDTDNNAYVPNVWNHIVAVYNGSAPSLKMYVNGNEITCTLAGVVPSTLGSTAGLPFEIARGRYNNGGYLYLTMAVDELGIWSRTLSSAEIKQQYYSNFNKYDTDKWLFYSNRSNLTNGTYSYSASAKDTVGNENSAGMRYWTTDTAAPIVTLVSPANNTLNTTTNNIKFFYNATDVTSDIANCSLILNNALNLTNASAVSETATNNFTATLANGNYNWSINCTDILGNTGASAVYNLSIDTDTINPNVTSVTDYPDPAGYGINITISAIVADSYGIDDVFLEITNPGSQKFNYTMTNVSSNYSYVFSNYTNGTYNYRIYANDTRGNMNSSETGSFDIYVNAKVKIKTLEEIYTAGEFVNLTDPPSINTFTVASGQLVNNNIKDVFIYNITKDTGYTSWYNNTNSDWYNRTIVDSNLVLDGTGDYIDVGNSSKTDFRGNRTNFTISAWVKYPSAIDAGIISKWSGASVQWLLWTSSNKFYFSVWDTAEQDAISSTVSTNTWYHVVGVANNGTLRLYLNGALNGTTDTYNVIANTSQNVWIGRYTNSYFKGNIDEISIWNRSLSAGEILNLYNAGPAHQTILQYNSSFDMNNLIAYWNFEQTNCGTTAGCYKDKASYLYNGTGAGDAFVTGRFR